MLIRTVRLTFDPAALADFDALFAETRASIRAQPGCRHLELWADARYPAVRTTYSLWDSAADLDAYRQTDLFRETWARTRRWFAAPPVAASHTRLVAEASSDAPAASAP